MNEKMKGADLIGKVIIVGENIASIEIKSAEGDTLKGEFKKGNQPPMPMTITLAQVEKMQADGVWKWADDTTATQDEVEEVSDVQPNAQTEQAGAQEQTADEQPESAKTVRMEPTAKPKSDQAKPQVTLKRKHKQSQNEPKPGQPTGGKEQAQAKVKYSTYQNKKGKQCARIEGLPESHEVYANAADWHASASKGVMVFGPVYAELAKDLADTINKGGSLSAIRQKFDGRLDAYREARAERRQAAQERRAARQQAKAEGAQGKVYTAQEVADLMRRVVAGDQEAIDLVNAINAKADAA